MNAIMMKNERKVKLQGQWINIKLCLLAFLMARIGVGEQFYTIGVAYLGTLYFSKTLRKWSWLFATCGIVSLTEFNIQTMKYILIFIVLGVIREYLNYNNIKLTLKNQLSGVGFSILIVNILGTFVEGYSLYGIATSILEALAGVGLCFIFHYGINVLKEQRRTPLTTKETISMILIFACVLGGFLDFYISVPLFKEIYFKDVLVFSVVAAVVYLGGTTLGVTIGMVISSILVIIDYVPAEYTGVFGVSALMGGLFRPLGKVGVMIGIGIGQVIGFVIFNDGKIDMPLIGAFAVAFIISFIIPKSYFGMAYWFQEKRIEENEKEHLVRVQYLITERLRHVVGGFEKLGKSFRSVQKPELEYTPKRLNAIIEETGEKLCEFCSMRNFCWKQDLKNTYAQAYEMIGVIEKQGFISKRDIPSMFSSHCLHAENFAYILSYKLDLLKQDIVWKNKFLENRSLVSEELSAIAETLKTLIQDIDQELYFNKEQEKNLKEMLIAQGIKVRDVMVLENNKKLHSIDVYTNSQESKISEIDICEQVIEKCVECPVVLEKHECKNKGCHYVFSVKNTYQIISGSAICAKEGISGDVHTCMELGDEQYLLALADGMGSGMLAYEESAAAMEMLEDFMESGFRKELAVKMINAALILKANDEIFSTMDITVIDRRTGVAEFLKAGASTSFILRDGEVITVRTSSLPVGIIKDVELEVKKVQLQSGDIIIMVTDGLLQSDTDVLGKEETFKHFIKEVQANDPQYLADCLMQKSKALLGVKERDDMTIVVARIWKEVV
ncbi:MAG: stage II sporulation protein E [Cellulosilyticaceae bacterium]